MNLQSERRGAAIEESGNPAAADPLMRLDKVCKTYETRDGPIVSLQPITLDVRAGEFVSIVGPSGCGKSTLLKMAAGLLPVTAGTLSIHGSVVVGPPEGVGIVFQNAVLLGWRDILDNIMLQVEIRRLPREPYFRRAMELIEMVDLKGFEHKLPWQLSGGMQQRAALCRALVHDPQILLMDEPFGALDAMTRERMNLDLQRIWSSTRKTVLLITHSIPEAVFLADRVVVLTERPGSIAHVYDVPLARPRSVEMMASHAFVMLTQTIRRHFFAKGRLDG